MEERFLLENNHRIIQYRPTYLQGSTISTTSSHHFRADSAVSFSTLPLDYSSVALFHCIAALPLYSSLQLLHCPLHGCCQCQSHAILAAKANDSSTISYCFQLNPTVLVSISIGTIYSSLGLQIQSCLKKQTCQTC